jgi:hypothetical protein
MPPAPPRRRGRPRDPRYFRAGRAVLLYTSQLPFLQIVCQWCRRSPEIMEEYLHRILTEMFTSEREDPVLGYFTSIGWGRLVALARRRRASALSLELTARRLKVTRAAAQHLLREGRRAFPAVPAIYRELGSWPRLAREWRRLRRPLHLLDEDAYRALTARLARIAREYPMERCYKKMMAYVLARIHEALLREPGIERRQADAWALRAALAVYTDMPLGGRDAQKAAAFLASLGGKRPREFRDADLLHRYRAFVARRTEN